MHKIFFILFFVFVMNLRGMEREGSRSNTPQKLSLGAIESSGTPPMQSPSRSGVPIPEQSEGRLSPKSPKSPKDDSNTVRPRSRTIGAEDEGSQTSGRGEKPASPKSHTTETKIERLRSKSPRSTSTSSLSPKTLAGRVLRKVSSRDSIKEEDTKSESKEKKMALLMEAIESRTQAVESSLRNIAKNETELFSIYEKNDSEGLFTPLRNRDFKTFYDAYSSLRDAWLEKLDFEKSEEPSSQHAFEAEDLLEGYRKRLNEIKNRKKES